MSPEQLQALIQYINARADYAALRWEGDREKLTDRVVRARKRLEALAVEEPRHD